jgi:diguanylate cyclase (GGDEF)-like protein
MRILPKLSIRGSLWLGVIVAAACVFLVGGLLNLYLRALDSQAAEKLRAVALAEAYAAQVAPVVLTGLSEDMQSFLDRLPLHPGTCLLAVLDRRDQALASRGNSELLDTLERLNRVEHFSKTPAAWPIAGDRRLRVPPLILAVVPVPAPDSSEPAAFLVHAVRCSETHGTALKQTTVFFVGLGLASLGGVMFGFSWLRSQVLAPIARLAEHAGGTRVSGHGQQSDVLVKRIDEIGETAQAIEQMRQELNEASGRAAHLQKSVDYRVAAETERITRELRRVERRISTDPLTRLGNRQLLLDKFTPIFEAQQRAGKDLSVVLLDVDYFKEVNDTLGHKAGDELLVFVGELLQQSLREHDLAIRHGGDEFLLILPSVSIANAAEIAERTLKLFAQQARVLAVQPKPSMSAGVASLLAHQVRSAEELLDMADQALYEAKKSGKSQVRIACGQLAVAGRR